MANLEAARSEPENPEPTSPEPTRPDYLELWLIRHGETDWNRERRIQGQQHNVLSCLGEQQARRLGSRLIGENFDTIYCSDLKRTVQTAALVFPGRTVAFDERLREIGRGVLEGGRGVDFAGEQLEHYHAMLGDSYRFRPPGGENHLDVQERAVAWLGSLPRSGKVAAITHGGVITALFRHALGLRDLSAWLHAGNTGISKLQFGDDWTQILGFNDTAHLEPQANLNAP